MKEYCEKCDSTRCDHVHESATTPADVELPELPEPVSSVSLAAWGPKPAYYTAEQMREYAATLARQLAEANKLSTAISNDCNAVANERNALQSQLAEATRRLGEVEAYRDATFDGNAVYAALDDRAKSRTSADNVADVLDALNRVARLASDSEGGSDAT